MPDVRSVVVIALADEIVRRPELLRAFAARFDGRDDVTLVLYAEQLPDGLVEVVGELGLDTPDAVDILALDGAPPKGLGHALLSEEGEPPAELADLPVYGAAAVGAIRTKPRYLSACTTFADEGLRLREWIEFHRLVGFEHFYLYDDRGTDESRSVVEPYVRAGIATVVEWPFHSGPVPAFQHCIEAFGHGSTWLAMIESDDFLFSPECFDVREILADYERFGGLVVNTMQYGTSGHSNTSDWLAIENFVRRAGDETAVFLPDGLRSPELDKTDLRNYHPLNTFVKSIVRPERVVAYRYVNYAIYAPGYYAVDELRQRVDGGVAPVAASRIRINCYRRTSPHEFPNHSEALNEVVDATALPLAPALRAALGLGPAPRRAEVLARADRPSTMQPGAQQMPALDTAPRPLHQLPAPPPKPRAVPRVIAEAGPGLAAELAEFVPWSQDEIKARLYYPGQPVEVPITTLGGLPIRVRPGTGHVCALRGTFDRARRYHLPPDDLDPKVIVDLGAHIGTAVADYAHRYPDAYVVGVEPDEDNAELARENVAAFGERVRIIRAGVSGTRDALRYRRDGDVGVRTLTLDSILRQAGVDATVDYLKMDIEGDEREVLRAGGRWTSRVRCLKVELYRGYTVEQAKEDVRNLGLFPYVDAKHHSCIVALGRNEKLLLVA
jgi:FkbM family methyltransferase